MWIFPFTFLIICVTFLVLFLLRASRRFPGHRNDRVPRETAREILDRRYAGGEIDSEQYEGIRRRLEGG
jgi:uncharacterized membrane protein